MATPTLRLAVPDLISNSYFPAVAAAKLGCFEQEGFDAALELIFPVDKAYEALKEGRVDFVAGSAHSALAAFPNWRGVKVLCAQAQGMYWFLVMHSDLAGRRGDLSVVEGRRIGAAPWVDMGLRSLLVAAGIDIEAQKVTIMLVSGAVGSRDKVVNFGITAARALADGVIDGFWANGMGTEVAVREGVGKVVLDVRRGDGPPGCFHYTFASIAATDDFLERNPAAATAAIRAIKTSHAMLRGDPGLAEKAVADVFPPLEASLIPELIRRDLPFYDPAVSRETVQGMNHFTTGLGLLSQECAYEEIVATRFAHLW